MTILVHTCAVLPVQTENRSPLSTIGFALTADAQTKAHNSILIRRNKDACPLARMTGKDRGGSPGGLKIALSQLCLECL